MLRERALLAFSCAVAAALAAAPCPAAAQAEAAPVGNELQVNTYTTGRQEDPTVAASGDGTFVVMWDSVQTNSFYHLFGQRIDASGTRIGAEFQVTNSTNSGEYSARLAPLTSGSFAVTWESFYPDPSADIFARRIDSTGAPIGAEFIVNTYTTGDQRHAAIAADAAGNFVVVWHDSGVGQDGDDHGVFGQRFDATGARIGGEFQVNTYTTSYQYAPSVAMVATGEFVVAWSGVGASDSYGIFGQRFDSGGVKVGAEFQINTYLTGYQYESSIATNGSGGFVVVWTDADGSSEGIFRRRLDASGTPVGSALQVNTYTTGEQRSPLVRSNDTGAFVVTWQSYAQDGHLSGIFAQQFDPAGAPVGSELQVSTYTTGNQLRPAVAVDDAGRFVVAWWDLSGHDGDLAGIFAQAFTPPLIDLERSALRFGVVRNGGTLAFVTPAQTVGLTAPGAWTAISDQPFISVTPSGSGTGTLTIQVASTTGLPTTGAAAPATITVTAPGASNSPQTITVNVQVYAPGTTSAAFGSFDTPLDNSTGVTGAIGITGWALDDIGIDTLELWRDPVNGDPAPAPNGKIFIGNATFVSGARPDVESLYAAFPRAYRAAWSYMLLTNLLPTVSSGAPAGGVGTFTLYAYVYDVDGNLTILPTRTFACDNTVAVKPFGTIDTPTQGQTASGVINNFGWVLTPQTATIPTNGSTITLFIDNIARGTATYGGARTDLATLFPGYNNTSGPVGVFSIDTTTLANGVHTIAWSAFDDQARGDGIGSRYFTVLN